MEEHMIGITPSMFGSLCILLVVVSTARPAPAQTGQHELHSTGPSTSQPAALRSLRAQGDSASLLLRPVSVNLEQTTLEQAMREIARQAGLELTYSQELVPAAKRVRLRADRIPAARAFAHVLRGTDLDLLLVSPRQAVLVRRQPAVSPVQQQGTVIGRVTSVGTGEGLAGANILVVGPRLATITASDGRYRLAGVPSGPQRIRVTRLGFEPAEEAITVPENGTATLDFALRASAVLLDPLEVTAQTGSLVATQRKRLGHSIEIVTEEEIERSGARDVRQVLRTLPIPGVASFISGGENGAGGLVQIRGAASFIQDQMPLVYVDGFPVNVGSGGLNRFGLATPQREGNLAQGIRLDELTTDQIERIEIIKGPAATTLYGTDAVNGVIQIFTKRGAAGETRITAEFEQGFSMQQTAGALPEDRRHHPDLGLIFRPDRTRRYVASLSGGSGGITYALGATQSSSRGVVVDNGSSITTLRTSFGIRPRDNFRVLLSGSFVEREYERRPHGYLLEVLDAGDVPDSQDPDFRFRSVPEALEHGRRSETDVSRLYAGATIHYQPFAGWDNQLTLGLDRSAEVNETFGRTSPSSAISRDRVTQDFARRSARLISSLAYPAAGRFTSVLSAGFEGFLDVEDRIALECNNVPSTRARDCDLAELVTGGTSGLPTETSSSVRALGSFLQEQVGIGDRLFVTAGLRVDGNSTFGDDYGLRPYPKLGAAYNFSPRAGWRAKARVGWGQSGRAPDPFAKVKTFNLLRNTRTGTPQLRLRQPGNEALGPELGTELEVGLENYFLGDQASATVNYFHQTTRDAILTIRLPLSTGFPRGRQVNVGGLRSQGIELSGNVRALSAPAATLTLGATLTHLIENGVVTSLGDELEFLSNSNQGNEYVMLEGIEVGESIRDVVVHSYFTRGGLPGLDLGRGLRLGSRVPTTYGGFSLTLASGPVAVATHFQYGLGATGFNRSLARRDRSFGYHESCCYYLPDALPRYTFSRDYLRLVSARLTYRLPVPSGLGLAQDGELWIEGRNLATLAGVPYGDPEVNNVLGVTASGVVAGGNYTVGPPPMLQAGLRVTIR